jgi:geranylgeranyl pyrophosphate synthase
MLACDDSVDPVLAEAMRYAVQGGGKRIRPYLVTRSCELCGGSADVAAPAAAAIECVHAFSLVHDDLPAMDDDDLRRGRPTCHKAYNEALAILAGDGLLALAFEILTRQVDDKSVASAAVEELARGTGWAGMIGGQAIDIQSEGDPPDLALVRRIHRSKTARLFECATRLGAIVAKADVERTAAISTFGRNLGLAFQIADDLLDVMGTAEQMGKAVSKDAEAGKQTYPAAAGLEKSKAAAEEVIREALSALDVFGPSADDLRALADFVIHRSK